jgi:hypothetical protein
MACVAEEGCGGVVENERRLEGGAGEAVFDARNSFAEVEAFGLRLRRGQNAPHAAAEVCGLSEIGCVFCARAAEGEDSRLRGDGAQDLVCAFGGEGYRLIEVKT